jgi:hypothetical protein
MALYSESDRALPGASLDDQVRRTEYRRRAFPRPLRTCGDEHWLCGPAISTPPCFRSSKEACSVRSTGRGRSIPPARAFDALAIHTSTRRQPSLSKRYCTSFEQARTHPSWNKDAPIPRLVAAPGDGRIVAILQVGGLHHRDERQAAWSMANSEALQRIGAPKVQTNRISNSRGVVGTSEDLLITRRTCAGEAIGHRHH